MAWMAAGKGMALAGKGAALAAASAMAAGKGAALAGMDHESKKEKNAWSGSWGGNSEALQEALEAVLAPIADQEPDIADIVQKIRQRMNKMSNKWGRDERASQRGTATQAKSLIEEFVEAMMGSISAQCYGKDWFDKVEWSPYLLSIVLDTFENAKIFNRTLAPSVSKHVEEGIYKWQEEERITKAIWDSLVAAGVPESHRKKANKQLLQAYDDAHYKAPFGSIPADSEEMSILQDFVKGWILEFTGKAWDVIESGMGAADRDSQVAFVTSLFQILCDPGVNCLPYEITNSLGGLPQEPWHYIHEVAGQVIDELSAPSAAQVKRMRIGM